MSLDPGYLIMRQIERTEKMDSLWPKDISSTVEGTAPVTALREQAGLLGRQTANIVEAQVHRDRSDRTPEGYFGYNFYLVGPLLSNYQHRLFTMYHNLNLYPLYFNMAADLIAEMADTVRAENGIVYAKEPAEYPVILKAIFAAKKTRRIIDAIIMQSGDD